MKNSYIIVGLNYISCLASSLSFQESFAERKSLGHTHKNGILIILQIAGTKFK